MIMLMAAPCFRAILVCCHRARRKSKT
jgi:hypothetical protein